MKRILMFAAFAAVLVILVLLTPSCDVGGGGGDAVNTAAGPAAVPGGESAHVDDGIVGDPAEAPIDAPPEFEPSRFTTVVDNPFFPLVPGTMHTFEGDTDEGRERVEMMVTAETRAVMGVTCLVVETSESLGAVPVEDTVACYAQDEDGTVWLFSEETTVHEDGGVLSSEGSWQAGVDGAQPGIAMPGDPRPGDTWSQEYTPGRSEDQLDVVENGVLVVLIGGPGFLCLKIREWDQVEPETEEYKYYAPGVGLVRAADPDGANAVDLVDVSKR